MSSDFFMQLSEALARTHINRLTSSGGFRCSQRCHASGWALMLFSMFVSEVARLHERVEHSYWRGLNFYGAMVSCGDRADRSNGTEFPSRDLLFGTVI